MEAIDKSQVEGIFEIHQQQIDGSFEKVHEQKNLMPLVGVINFLKGIDINNANYAVSHFAVGNGSTPVDKTDTIVEGEYERVAITDTSLNSDAAYEELVVESDLTSGQGNGTIRKAALIGHGPTTTLANYNPADPDESGHEWVLSNTIDVLLPNGKVKDNTIILKFIWRIRINV